jgi:hypothetical protein
MIFKKTQRLPSLLTAIPLLSGKIAFYLQSFFPTIPAWVIRTSLLQRLAWHWFSIICSDSTTGGSAGSAYEFFTQVASSGTVSFDLTSLVGSTLGLQFQLTALPGDTAFDSNVTIQNVRLEQLPESTVPEPGSGGLIIVGLCCWSLVRVYRAKAKQPGNLLRISFLD